VPARSPLGFQANRLLLVGCGDVGLRVVRALGSHWRVFALTSSPERLPLLRAAGVVPLLGNLDQPDTLHGLGALAPNVLHLAPPAAASASVGRDRARRPDSDPHADTRTRNLLKVLARSGVAQRLVYASTTGVYGDAQGAWVNECRAVAPATDRARRRVSAEAQLRRFASLYGVRVSVLRIPGIYALDREEGNPVQRLAQGTAVPAHDVYTNRIHADDLARACVAALMRGRFKRCYNVCDDGCLPLAATMEQLADHVGLPRPKRITAQEAQQTLSPMALSFWAESRRLCNERLKQELKVRLRYPTLLSSLPSGP
jgi:nucleoside-diphosphate-sugar epimerase